MDYHWCLCKQVCYTLHLQINNLETIFWAFPQQYKMYDVAGGNNRLHQTANTIDFYQKY